MPYLHSVKLSNNILIIIVALLFASCGMNGHNNFNKQKFTNLVSQKAKKSPLEINKEEKTKNVDASVYPTPSSSNNSEVKRLPVFSKDEIISPPEEKEIIQEELNSHSYNIETPIIVKESNHPKKELIEKTKSSNKKILKKGAGTMAALLIAGIFLLVAGLGFLLIGAILALFSGGLGTVFLVIGGILIVLALVLIILGASS